MSVRKKKELGKNNICVTRNSNPANEAKITLEA
jgi:hypothetical protein